MSLFSVLSVSASGMAVQRKFWVMPVVGPLTLVRPGGNGPWTELGAGGVILTGEKTLADIHRCAIGLANVAGRWRCTAKRTATTFNALKSGTFTRPGNVVTTVSVSADGANPVAPPNFVDGPVRSWFFGQWMTAEPSGL